MNQSFLALNRRTALYCAGVAISLPSHPGRSASPAAASSEPGVLPLIERQKQLLWRDWPDETAGGSSSGNYCHPEEQLPNSQGELEEDEDMESESCGPPSLPESPTPPSDPLRQDTYQLLLRYFGDYACGQAGGKAALLGSPTLHRALETLHRVGGDIIDKHRIAFQGMLTKLSIQRAEDLQKLSEVPSLVFSDGITNWGRIVTLISFGAFLAKYLKSIKLEDCIIPLADNFTNYLMTSKRDWIAQQKSWDGFVEFFHVEDYESGLRTVLMTFAGVAGLGASLAYMIR